MGANEESLIPMITAMVTILAVLIIGIVIGYNWSRKSGSRLKAVNLFDSVETMSQYNQNDEVEPILKAAEQWLENKACNLQAFEDRSLNRNRTYAWLTLEDMHILRGNLLALSGLVEKAKNKYRQEQEQ